MAMSLLRIGKAVANKEKTWMGWVAFHLQFISHHINFSPCPPLLIP